MGTGAAGVGQSRFVPRQQAVAAPQDAGAALAVSRRASAALDLWDGDAWVPAGMAAAPQDDLLIGLPTNALDDGALYVRVQMSCEFWGMQNPFPSVRATGPDDDVLTIGALGEGSS